MEKLENKRIALLLSGGVDSSVVLHELCEKGVKPDCFYIKIGPEEDEEWDWLLQWLPVMVAGLKWWTATRNTGTR